MAERGQLYLRLEHDQWKFARKRGRSYYAAIVAAKQLAPYPPGHRSFGKEPDRLAVAVAQAKRALVVDPGTPQLTSTGVLTYKGARRLRATAAAQAMGDALPLTAETLRQSAQRDRLVDATMEDQRLAKAVAPPYLEPRSREDLRHQLNLLMLRRVVQSAGTQVPVAFVQVTLSKLRNGLLEEIAGDYAAAGAERIFLRVRGFGELAGAEDFGSYLDAIDAFAKHRLDVVADCVGRLGPLLVHEGALGFSTGTMIYRSVAKDLLHDGEGGSSQTLTVESPTGWYEIPRTSEAVAQIEPCPVDGCPVGHSTNVKLDDIREHRLHTFERHTQQAIKQETPEFAQALRQTGQAGLARYAAVLEERYRRAA
jgi:hypothetical protein